MQEFFNALKPLGFVPTEQNTTVMTNINPEPVSLTKFDLILDVRPILSSDKDPFHVIMSTLKELPEGKTLKLINSFEPTPLYKILDCKGYVHTCTKLPGQFNIYITKVSQGGISTEAGVQQIRTFAEVLALKKDCLEKLDVSAMEMPLPMITILKKLDEIDADKAIYVTHRKFPHLLIPELEARNYSFVHESDHKGEHHIIIYRPDEF
jgi:uncharacterized protein (DUF2249 family)